MNYLAIYGPVFAAGIFSFATMISDRTITKITHTMMIAFALGCFWVLHQAIGFSRIIDGNDMYARQALVLIVISAANYGFGMFTALLFWLWFYR